MKIKTIREIIWPLLDSENTSGPKISVLPENIKVTGDDLDTCYDLAVKFYEDENDRKSSVESKSTIFVSSIGFTTAILIAVTKDLVLNNKFDSPFTTYIFIILLVGIVVYMARAVWFAIKVLERKNYDTIGYEDIISANGKNNYKAELSTKMINKTIKNRDVVNLKVDYMVMAHEYFKRAIVLIVAYSVALAITFPVIRYIYEGNSDDRVIKILSCTNTGTWLLSAVLLVSVVQLYLIYKNR
jgi:hypothetical protein